jgi:glyoxylase-like metal-dependent hydrolase (beta-lactamase superfamily II)
MIFDDGKHRVELLHFGVAHTHGDGFAWLPKEKILFTGDACVNGPFNYAADGDIGQWIGTLEAAKQLGAEQICPGHGPMGPGSVLNDQQAFFKTLRGEVQKLVAARKTSREAREAVPEIKALLQKDNHIARYVGGGLEAQVEKAWTELGGKPFMSKEARRQLERDHALDHGAQLAEAIPTAKGATRSGARALAP